jgi:hypothetical protein
MNHQFEEYINNANKFQIHPKLLKLYQQFPDTIQNFKNIIFYGPSGVGKYTQSLLSILKYSPSQLRYEKKTSYSFDSKKTKKMDSKESKIDSKDCKVYFLKLSDIHYEVDMALLGCNPKQIWHELYQLINDIISAKKCKCGIIICKNFHDINEELHDIFYSYMQLNINKQNQIKFILLTESYSFINPSILNICATIHVPRPKKNIYKQMIINACNIDNVNINEKNINNIYNLKSISNTSTINLTQLLCDDVIQSIIHYEKLQFIKFRELLYKLLNYNVNIYFCIWNMISFLIQLKNHFICEKNINDILTQTFLFCKQYNNNFRPIFHLENYFLFIINKIHIEK